MTSNSSGSLIIVSEHIVSPIWLHRYQVPPPSLYEQLLAVALFPEFPNPSDSVAHAGHYAAK
jgi:hypothetical protein